MNLVEMALLVFVIIESLNIATLYFNPGLPYGNGMGVFKAWANSIENPNFRDFTKYLVNWVAGTKLIFVGLICAILIFGDANLQAWTLIVLVISIFTFYWRLYPLMKKMDDEDQLNQKGYSKTLGIMIVVFILVFVLALIWFLANL